MYTNSQRMVCHISPDNAGPYEDPWYANKFEFNPNKLEITLNDVYCYSTDATSEIGGFSGYLGWELKNADTGKSSYGYNEISDIKISIGYPQYRMSVNSKLLTEGDYVLMHNAQTVHTKHLPVHDCFFFRHQPKNEAELKAAYIETTFYSESKRHGNDMVDIGGSINGLISVKFRVSPFVITLGTGVGSGIVVNGQLLYGHDGFAGELGHVTMVRGEEGRLCGCGRTGCLEAYCSATGVARTARELLMKTDRPSLLREMDPEKITSLDVSIAAGKGDELAKEIYEFTGKMLGEACADFAAFSSPEAFIFFGGMVKAGDLIMKPIQEAYNNHVLKIFKNKAQFLVSGLDGASAAVLGASAIGWEIQ